ncbi:MAG: hypothetical protein QM708_10345 [Propioniciclava sp.]|uniref:hypothetical protein n=1 Tax=Propioniciclava sp. TaxID=2038686 RepID=UPI0039E56F6C
MISRRLLLTGATSGAALTIAGCTLQPRDDDTPPRLPPNEHRIVASRLTADLVLPPGPDGALATSRALLAAATAVVVIGPGAGTTTPTPATPTPTAKPARTATPAASPSAQPARPDPHLTATAAQVARDLGLPFFAWSPGLIAELDRLQTRTVIAYDAEGLDFGSREVIPGPAEAAEVSLPGLPATPPGSDGLSFAHGEIAAPTATTLAAAGLRPLGIPVPHPGADLTSTAHVRAHQGPVVAIGEGFGDDQQFATQVKVTRTAPEFPGGGVVPFPGRHMIALYGHPSTPALGMMGEQPPAAAVARLTKLVDQYKPLITDDEVMGAFEIITTVASAQAGGDGDYSHETPIEQLMPWIEAAEKAGIYVVLDLQPGRTDFLTQAKRYEELLRRPRVGLALDPEWRLRPDGRHLVSIGQVGVDEVNRVGTWLADLVQAHELPPKVLILHQFQTRMITERARLDTTRPEVQYLVHVDGQGSQGDKQNTWAAIRANLPARTWLGWKNFEDEDAPMLTPAQTVAQVRPTPQFISYQ